MQTAIISARVVRLCLLAAALALWASVDHGVLLAQGVEPFGEVPDSRFGNTLPFGSVRAPTAPEATSRPASWPGGSTLEPEQFGGPAVRSASPIASRAPADARVVRTSSLEPVSAIDQDPGFAFAEGKGAPQAKAPPAPSEPAKTLMTTPANAVQAQPAVTVPLRPSQTAPLAVGVAAPTVSSQPLPTILNPDRVPPAATPADPAAQPGPPAQASTGVLRNPFQEGLPLEPSPLRERVDNSAGVSRPGDPGYHRPGEEPVGRLRNPFAAFPPNVPAASVPPTTVLPPATSASSNNATVPTMSPGVVVRNPTIAPVGEAFASDSEQPATAPPAPPQTPAAAAPQTPAQPPVTASPAQPTTRPKPPPSADAPPEVRRGVSSAQAFPFAPPATTPAPSATPQTPVAQAFPFAPPATTPAPSAAPQTPVASVPPVPQSAPAAATSTFHRETPAMQAFPFAAPSAASSASRSAAAPASTALAASAASPSRYRVESKSSDTPAASVGLAAFPTQIPTAPAQAAARPSKMLLAQATVPNDVLADSAVRGPTPAAAPEVSTNPGVSAAPGLEPGLAPCEGAQILARVGSEIILAADIAGPVNEIIQMNKDKIPPEQIEIARQHLTRRFLDARIETKLAYLDAKRNLPAEALAKVERNIRDVFDREEIEKLMKRAHADSRQDLENKLQSLGSSLELKRQTFVEQALAHQWMRQKVKVDGEVSHEEMHAYYRDHITEFETPAKARWEELEIRFSKHPNRQEAYALIAQLGNRVLGGTPLAEVARQGSEGLTASTGGQRDWVTRGSLVSQELDHALFGLPVGEPSQIIEDKTGLHILRVLERKDAVRTPFTEAQVEIRKKIKDQRTEAEMKAFLDKLRRQVPVWTVYDDKPGNDSRRG